MTRIIPIDEPTSPDEIAQHLRRMRELSGMSKLEAANRQGLSVRTIEACEEGRNLVQFCQILALFESYGCVLVIRPPAQNMRNPHKT